MSINFDALLINIIVSVIVVTPALWLSGRGIVGKDKARFIDAVWIIILGIVVGTIIGAFVIGIIGSIIQLVLWLALVKHFFDSGWLQALAISIVAVIIFVVITIILGIIGFTLITFI
jgi:hypothetical protein